MKKAIIFILGFFFGIILLRSEVVSWFRIQEMFRFEAFHMYGVMGSAVVTGVLAVFLIKKLGIKDKSGQPIDLTPKPFNKKANLIGGVIFGFGWALTGACPGPLYALVGYGYWIVGVVLLSAVGGAWLYNRFRHRLPH